MPAQATPTLNTKAVLRESDRRKKAAAMQYLAQQFRVTVLDILHEKQTGHWGGAASAARFLKRSYWSLNGNDVGQAIDFRGLPTTRRRLPFSRAARGDGAS
jgi:hypothetical protein